MPHDKLSQTNRLVYRLLGRCIHKHTLIEQLGNDGLFTVGIVPYIQKVIQRSELTCDDFFSVVFQASGNWLPVTIKIQLSPTSTDTSTPFT